MTDPLTAALDAHLGHPDVDVDDGWESFGLLRNPYPTRSHPNWSVFHNQEEVRDRFYSDLGTFLKSETTTTLFFTGGNRVGKTHFMEHHRRSLPPLLAERGIVLPISVVRADTANLYQLYQEFIDQIYDGIRDQTGELLFAGELPDPVQLAPSDFRRAIERLVAASASDTDHLRVLLLDWIRGARLRASQRNDLGVSGLVDSQSQVVSTFGGLVRFLQLRRWELDGARWRCPGVLVFVDEFELIWKQRRDRRDQFLQGLRALVDVTGGTGGLFLCVGMATGLGVEIGHVETDYPALYARMRGARDIPALLEIDSGVVGIEYARKYDAAGREAFRAARDTATVPREPGVFTDREIDSFFRELVGTAMGGTVTQADFFDKLHAEAESRVRERRNKR